MFSKMSVFVNTVLRERLKEDYKLSTSRDCQLAMAFPGMFLGEMMAGGFSDRFSGRTLFFGVPCRGKAFETSRTRSKMLEGFFWKASRIEATIYQFDPNGYPFNVDVLFLPKGRKSNAWGQFEVKIFGGIIYESGMSSNGGYQL